MKKFGSWKRVPYLLIVGFEHGGGSSTEIPRRNLLMERLLLLGALKVLLEGRRRLMESGSAVVVVVVVTFGQKDRSIGAQSIHISRPAIKRVFLLVFL